MAKPILATPTLKGHDAEIFLKNMIRETNNPNPIRVRFIKEALSKSEMFERALRRWFY